MLFGAGPALVFLLGLCAAFLLRRTIRHTDAAPDAAPDERLVAVRNAAYRTGYPALVVGTMAAMLVLLIGVGEAVEGRHVSALFFTFALGAMLTPTAVLAWREPEI